MLQQHEGTKTGCCSRLGNLNHGNLLAHNPGGWRCKIEVSAGSVSSEAPLIGLQVAAYSCVLTRSSLCAWLYSNLVYFMCDPLPHQPQVVQGLWLLCRDGRTEAIATQRLQEHRGTTSRAGTTSGTRTSADSIRWPQAPLRTPLPWGSCCAPPEPSLS